MAVSYVGVGGMPINFNIHLDDGNTYALIQGGLIDNLHNQITIYNYSTLFAVGSISGTAPDFATTATASGVVGFIIPPSTIDGGVRVLNYSRQDFTSLIIKGTSGVNLRIEFARSKGSPISG